MSATATSLGCAGICEPCREVMWSTYDAWRAAIGMIWKLEHREHATRYLTEVRPTTLAEYEASGYRMRRGTFTPGIAEITP